MMTASRYALTVVGAGVAFAGACSAAYAQAVDTKAVDTKTADTKALSIIVGFGAGGSADSIARIVGNRLGEKLGRNVVIENRPGAGANIAAKAVIAAAPDGTTLLATTAALAINNTLYKSKGFDIADLRPVSIAATTPETLAVNKTNPAKTLAEFVALNKGRTISYASAGLGTGSHIVAAYFFKTVAGIEANHVPFRSGPDATNALLGGHVDFMASSLSGFAAQVNSGDIRGIAIATAERFPAVPNVPTYKENGYPGHVYSSWAGFFTHAKAPDAVVARLNAEIVDILKEKGVNDRLVAIGFAPLSGELKDTQGMFKQEIDDWAKMVRATGLSVE